MRFVLRFLAAILVLAILWLASALDVEMDRLDQATWTVVTTERETDEY